VAARLTVEGGRALQELIREAIVRKARAVLHNQRVDRATHFKNADRYRKRTGLVPGTPSVVDPSWWSFHPHFEPRYCITHADFLARTIWRKLSEDAYRPIPAIQFDIEWHYNRKFGTTHDTVLHGRCTRAPFSGFPRLKF
jgi:RNA-directed DNA polymerase